MKQTRKNQIAGEQSVAVSYSPNDETFPLSLPDDYPKEFQQLQKLVNNRRKEKMEIVVVRGVGYGRHCGRH